MDNNSVNDLYTPPQATTTIEPQGEPLRFWGTTGRIGRLRYIAWLTGASLILFIVYCILFYILLFLGVFSIYGVLNGFRESLGLIMLLLMFLGVLSTVFIMCCTMQRLQDFDFNKWFALLIFLPIINTGLLLTCMIISGNSSNNKYGPPPPENSLGVIILAILFFIIAPAGLFAFFNNMPPLP